MLVMAGWLQAGLAALALAPAAPAEIAYVNTHGIVSSRADGSAAHVLVAGRHLSEPAWSPDGSRLVFAESAPDGMSSHLRLLGGELTPLRANVIESSPAWSPDGAQLAFARITVRGDDITTAIVARDVATGAERSVVSQRLDARLTSVDDPAWAPNGVIAYTRVSLDRHAYF